MSKITTAWEREISVKNGGILTIKNLDDLKVVGAILTVGEATQLITMLSESFKIPLEDIKKEKK